MPCDDCEEPSAPAGFLSSRPAGACLLKGAGHRRHTHGSRQRRVRRRSTTTAPGRFSSA